MRPLAPAMTLLALVPVVLGADLYVETAGDDATNDCTASAAPCATIEHALAVANVGDAVNVGAGAFSSTASTYPLTVPNGVAVVGGGADLTTVNATTPNLLWVTGPVARIEGLHLGPNADTLVAGDNLTGEVSVSLLGTTLEGTSAATGLDLSGSLGHGSLTVSDNTFTGLGQAAQFNVLSPGPWDISITGNVVHNGSDGAHIVMDGTTEAPFNGVFDTRVTATGNTFEDLDGSAINVVLNQYATAAALVQDNTFARVASSGFRFTASTSVYADVTAKDNTFDDTRYPVHVDVYDDCTLVGLISGNTMRNSVTSGIDVDVSSSTNTVDVAIIGNTITDTVGIGIRAGITSGSHNAMHALIQGNTVTGSTEHGLYLAQSYDSDNDLFVELFNNTLSDNAGDGVHISASSGAFYGNFRGNVITGNADNGIWATSDDPGFFLDLKHNTISHNAADSATSGAYDVNASSMYYFDILAQDNWWGSTDRDVIDGHLYTAPAGQYGRTANIIYTALDPTLTFSLNTALGPDLGGQTLIVTAPPDAPPMVWTAGINPLVVDFGGEAATNLSLSHDGRTLIVQTPPHAPGVVDVTVTNPGGQTGTLAGPYEYLGHFADADADHVEDTVDNCVDLANTDQRDLDDDGVGDACDDDWDGDTFLNDVDVCPWIADDQSDGDGDGVGDACDDDLDDDGVVDTADNCAIANPDQADQDADGVGDVCDLDADGDGVLDVNQVAVDPAQGGCACSSGPSAPSAPLSLGLLALGALARRRRR